MSWLQRVWVSSIAVAAVACGASVSPENYGPTGAMSDGGTSSSDVTLPASPSDAAIDDWGVPTGLEAGSVDGGAPCPPSTTSGKAHLCVTVGVGTPGPAAAIDATSLGIDGTGVLVVGLAGVASGPPTADTKYTAFAELPSVASGATLHVADLPKTVEIDVEPGTYYVAAAFRDSAPFDRKTAAVGDYVQPVLSGAGLPTVTAIAGVGQSAPPITLAPVRGVDATFQLGAALSFPGSGAGPLVARMTESGSTNVAALAAFECVDLAYAGPKTVRLFLTSDASDFEVRAALFDYAKDLTDPGVLTWLDPMATIASVPVGSICEGLKEKAVHVYLPPGQWLAAPVDVYLDDVWGAPAGGASDPSVSCHSIAMP
ncbi:MAG: hypothetical protein ACHREM_31975 [Polyangiales bacterium]